MAIIKPSKPKVHPQVALQPKPKIIKGAEEVTPLKPCLDCGRPSPGIRCAQHQREQERRRGTPAQRGYTKQYFRNRNLVVKRQPWCSTCGSSEDLTADHIVPLSQGGTSELSNLRTLCKSCNSRKGRGVHRAPNRAIDLPRDISTHESFESVFP